MRAILPVVIAFSTSIIYSQNPDSANPSCTQAGLVFGVHSFGSRIILKGPTGNLSTVSLNERTSVLKLDNGRWSALSPGGMSPASTGDLVCAVSPGEGKPATRVHIVPRETITERQQKFLGEWQKSSLYGNIEAIDPARHTITVKSGRPAAESVPVQLGSDVRFRAFPTDATRIQDAKPFAASDLRVGEKVYVWGPRAAGSNAVDAKIVATGGVHATVGSILAIQPLTSTIRIRELAGDRTLNVKLVVTQLFRTAPAIKSPTEIRTPAGVPLASVGFADLGVGDSVLVIGRGEDTDVTGLIMVTAFGSFGVGVDDPTSQLSWVLK